MPRPSVAPAFFIGALLLAGIAFQALPSAAEDAVVIAPPAVDLAAGPATTATAVFAGGCFWGVQGVFQHVAGVTGAVSGYAGGAPETADYQKVSRGWTGHAEVVRVTYDPRQVSYGRLMQVFFSVAHDPTELDRQGPDVGTQYRSAIFPQDDGQAKVAQAYIAQLDQARAFPKKIATRIEPGQAFHPAEEYHQDYMVRHPRQPYIVINDLPKVENLKRLFPDLYRDKPVLVAEAGQ